MQYVPHLVYERILVPLQGSNIILVQVGAMQKFRDLFMEIIVDLKDRQWFSIPVRVFVSYLKQGFWSVDMKAAAKEACCSMYDC